MIATQFKFFLDRGWAVPLVLIAAILAAWGAGRIGERNRMDPWLGDAASYNELSSQFAGSFLPGGTDGVRNELYTFVGRRLAPTGTGDFADGLRRANAWLAGMMTALLGAVFLWTLRPADAVLLTYFYALGLAVPIAQYVAAENLYWGLFALAFIGGCLTLRTGRAAAALATGVAVGLAYLAKPSTGPLLTLLGACLLVRGVLAWRAADGGRRALGPVVVPFACVVLAASAVMLPRWVYAAGKFEGAFDFNAAAYHFWADSWEQCLQKYMDCSPKAMAKMPPGERPTAANYFRRNGWEGVIRRAGWGGYARLRQLLLPANPFRFLPREMSESWRTTVFPFRDIVALGFLALPAMAVAGGSRLPPVGGSLLWPALFAVGTLALYLVASAWYFPIASGYRFTNALVLPMCWFALYVRRELGPCVRKGEPAVCWGLAALVTSGILLLLFDPRPFAEIWQTF